MAGGIVWVVDRLSDADAYEAYAKDLVRFAAGLVGPSDAGDVVSAAVLRVLGSTGWHRARNQRAYLFRSVVNEARMVMRSESRRVVRERLSAPAEAVFDHAEEGLGALAALSVRQRSVVVLFYWADLDQQSIADLLGISRGAVSRHLGRAHARLREVMSDEHDS